MRAQNVWFYGNFWSSQKINNLQKPYEKLATKANTVKKVSIAALVTSIHRIVTRKVHLPRENNFYTISTPLQILEKHQNSSKIVTKSLSFKQQPYFFKFNQRLSFSGEQIVFLNERALEPAFRAADQ